MGSRVVGFVAARGVVRSFDAGRPRPTDPPPDLAARLLAPAAREIADARRVRVLASRAIAAVDVHALPLDGRPLVAKLPVVYGLDLGGEAPSSDGVRSALVVADPTGDLPSAREEGASVATALRGAWKTTSLAGRDATAARVREELARAVLFHYAGHGVFAGREGAESALPLAQGGALTLGDVLALPRAPSLVVLSGCEAGRDVGVHDEGAAGLAQAFVLAGARAVVAPVRVVDDRASGALARDLHAPRDGGDLDLAAALREAQIRAIEGGRPGWEAFRAFAR
jgi:hypothetical protein